MTAIKTYFLSVCFLIHGLCAQKNPAHPELARSGKEMQDLVPYGWRVLSQASGDLNGDGREDLVFALQNTLKENYEYNDGLGVDTLDLNPRMLGIYFGKRNGKLKKALQSNTFIINRDVPTMDEPLDGLQILPNGDLQIDFHFWYSAGSWHMSNDTYRFRFQNKAFELIAYEKSERHRGTGDEIDHSIDFENGTLKIITTTIDANEEREYKEESKKFELRRLKSIKTLGKPFEWEFQQLRI